MRFIGIYSASVFLYGTSFLLGQGSDPASVGFLHNFKADAGGSEVSVSRFSVKGGLPVFKNEYAFVAFSATFATDSYNFEGDFNPWETIHRYSIGVPIFIDLDENWKWSTILRAGSAAEKSAKVSDSYTWGGVSSLNYKFSEDLTIGPGLSFFSQLEDDSSIFPILSVKWNFHEDWTLATGPSEGANSGANLYVNYSGLDRWELSSGVYYQNNRFRLSNDSTAAEDGVGEETSIALYGVAKYFPNDNISVSLISGISFGNEYNVFDNSGGSIQEESSENSAFVGLRLNYTF